MSNGEQLWAKLLKALYFPQTEFLQANKSRRPSWIWSSLCDSREALRLGARKNCMSGRNINVFSDPWIPSIPGFRLSRQCTSAKKAVEWIKEDGSGWLRDEVRNHCSLVETEAIIKIPVGPERADDKWVWHFDKRGNFSVKSAYHALHSENAGRRIERTPIDTDKKWKWLWTLQIPPKFKFFIWRASNNALATSLNLWRRKCSGSPVCQICWDEEEDIIHCLFQCPHASRV
ncbi:Putative ribonuclease H protein At1g65750 [Linum perenne]